MKQILAGVAALAALTNGVAAHGALAPAAASPAWQVAQAGAITADKEAAGRLAAQGWLVLLDRKDWGRAWETTGSLFRGKVPLGMWMDSIPKVREPMGELGERTPIETGYKTSLPGQPEGEYVTVVFSSKFANREVAEVVTTVHEPDGKWRVTGYSAQ